jgi:hypothetical protein
VNLLLNPGFHLYFQSIQVNNIHWIFVLVALSQFQVLALLYHTASTSVSNALIEFERQKLLSSHVLSQVNFNAQIDAFIQHLQTTTLAIPNDFWHSISLTII